MQNKYLRVLVIENDEADARQIERMLKQTSPAPSKIVQAGTLKDALGQLSRHDFQIIFLDLSLSDSQGLNAFDKIYEQANEVPIIVLSSFEDDTFGVQAVRKGAQDYLVKDHINVSVFGRVMKHAIERKRCQEQVKESEQRFRQFFENAPEYCYMLSLSGKILDINHAALKALGYAKKDIVGRSIISTIYAPSSRKRAKELFLQWKKKGMIQNQQLKIMTNDGQERDVLLSVQTIRDAQGRALHAVSIQRDITQLQEAQAAYQLSEEKYKNLFEHMRAGVVHVDLKGRNTFVSPKLCAMFEAKEKDLLGKFFWKAVHAQDQKRARDLFKRALVRQATAPGPYEIKCITRKGRPIDIEFRSSAVFKKDKLVGFQAVLYDVTERKKIQLARRESEKKLQSLIANLPDLILMLDHTGKILFANRNVPGFPPAEQMIGALILAHLPSFEHARCMKEIKHALQTGETVRSQYTDKQGNYYLTRCIPVEEEGRRTTVVVIAHDVTESRRREELSRQYAQLRRLITTISADFINMDPSQVDGGIDSALNTVGNFLNIDRACVFLFSKDKKTIKNTHEWRAKGIRQHIKHLQGVPVKKFTWFYKRLSQQKIINVPDTAQLPKSAHAEKKELKREHVQSMILTPMTVENEMLGFICLDTVKKKMLWPEEMVALLQILADVFANALFRKNINAQIKESEQTLRKIIDLSPSFVFAKDKTGKFILVNKAVADVYGAKAEDIIGKKDIDFTKNAAEAKHFRADDLKIIQSGKKKVVSEEIITECTGKERVLRTTKIPFKVPGTDDPAVLGVSTNITQYKKVERALRESEARYRTAVNSMVDPIHVVNKELKVVLVNRAIKKWNKRLGIKKATEGISLFDLYPFLPARAKREYQKVFRTGKMLSTTERTAINGQNVITETRKIPISDEKKTTHVLTVIRDITAQKQAEEALKASEAKFKMLVDYTYDWETFRDKNGKLLYVSPSFERITGYKAKDYLSGKIKGEEIVHPQDRAAYRKYFKRYMSGKPIENVTRRIIRKDGAVRYIAVTAQPVKDGKGHFMGVRASLRDVTEQRQAEEALRQSEARLRAAMDNLPFDFFVIDENGRYALQNPISKKNWGNLVGKKPSDVAAKDKQAWKIWKEKNQRAFKGEVVRGEVLLTVRGKKRYFHNVVAPIKDKGKVRGILGANIDIHDRKTAEKALRSSEARYRSVYTTAPLGFVLWDKECRIIDWNRRAEQMFGWSRKEVIGKNFLKILIPKTEEAYIRKVVDNILKGDIEPRITNKNLTKSGKEITCEWNSALLYDENNNVRGVMSLALDVSERVRAEEALKQREVLLRTVFDTIPHWIFVKDRASKVILVNKKMADDYGMRPEDFIDKPIATTPLGKKEERAFCVYVDHEVIEKGKTQDIPEESFTSLSGQQHYLRTVKVPLKDDKGKIVGLVGVAEDITQKKQQERELDEYRQHLEELVDERTRELRQSVRLAATGRLAASMAHEINNPLQGITTHLEIIREALPANFKKKKNYAEVKNNIEKIKNIVARLLNMSRPAEDQKETMDVNTLIREVADLVEHQLSLKKIFLKLQLARRLPKIYGWRQRLQQVLLNLLLNAQDSIQQNGHIWIVSKLNKDKIEIAVEDSGDGIKKEDLENIFDPFFTTKKEAGTGLGLFISQGIIKEHNGEIKVKSRLREGATFIITLPAE